MGDSRAVLSRGGRAVDLSAEHRVWGKTPAVQVDCLLFGVAALWQRDDEPVQFPGAQFCCLGCCMRVLCLACAVHCAPVATVDLRRLHRCPPRRRRLRASSRWAAGWMTAASAACWLSAGAASHVFG